MSKLMLEDIDVQDKCVLVRVDFNVPVVNGFVTNDRRIRASIPTLSYLLKHGCRLVLISHLGRPNGKRINKLSLSPCARILSDLLAREVIFLDDCIGAEVENIVNNLTNGQIVLLENLRFHKQEVQNNLKFAKKLSKFADLYVNDAFGTSHRAHASTEGVTHFIACCVMGFLVRKELLRIREALENPTPLFVCVLGGSKISNKLSTIASLLPKVDKLILGGGMVYTFFKAKGLEIGNSLFDATKVPLAEKILENFQDKLLLPSDCLVTDSLDIDTLILGNTKYVSVNSIEKGWCGIDIGKKSIEKFSDFLRLASTIVWSGPLGIFEIDKAAVGTFSIAKAIGEATENGAVTIVGGGDSVSAIEGAKIENKIHHISTGGGALLQSIEDKALPGVDALTDR